MTDFVHPCCGLTHRSDHNPADLLPCGGFSWELWMARLSKIHRAYWEAKVSVRVKSWQWEQRTTASWRASDA